MNHLKHIIYVSSARELLSEKQLNELLSLCRIANKKHNITGLLLYEDGNYMQVIEGEAADIDQLYFNIQHDQKHTGIITLLNEPIQQREFSNWSMAFKNLSLEEKEGFSDFMSTSAEDSLLSGNANTLLLSFKKSLQMRSS